MSKGNPLVLNIWAWSKTGTFILRITVLAVQVGSSKSAIVRSLIMGAEIKPRPPTEWPELIRQISAIGNNINQLVRVANSEKSVSPEVLRDMMRLQAAVWEKVKNL